MTDDKYAHHRGMPEPSADRIEDLFGVRPPDAPIMRREDHLAWAKERALELLDAGDAQQAFTSMASDLRKHPDLEDHPGIELGMMQLMAGLLNTDREVRNWITGFN